MPSATLSIPPSVEHVRTARLVVAAAARRAGFDDATVDDVRLAVGELVARAVLRHGAVELVDAVEVVVREHGPVLEVEVRERSDVAVPDEDDGVALALVSSLVADTEHHDGVVRLRWRRQSVR
jgi:anti-sigma regulatory factor (Ser/Thr protein kinase)